MSPCTAQCTPSCAPVGASCMEVSMGNYACQCNTGYTGDGTTCEGNNNNNKDL